jgi:hypothetical protein
VWALQWGLRSQRYVFLWVRKKANSLAVNCYGVHAVRNCTWSLDANHGLWQAASNKMKPLALQKQENECC